MQLICSFNNLSIGYRELSPIASRLSIDLHSGEILRVTGDNGSGKTTFLKTLLGEIQPLDGSIKRFYTKPYYLKQSFRSRVHLPMTVSEILGHDCTTLSFDTNTCWNDLSGGQKQQVLIHRAFQEDIDLLVLDEPFNHLDKSSIGSVKKLIDREFSKKKNSSKKFAVILVSHLATSFSTKTKELIIC